MQPACQVLEMLQQQAQPRQPSASEGTLAATPLPCPNLCGRLNCRTCKFLYKTCSNDPAGQGANQALEDAAELGWAVQQHGPTAEALRAYEMERLERVRTIVGTEQVGAGWCGAPCACLSSSGHGAASPSLDGQVHPLAASGALMRGSKGWAPCPPSQAECTGGFCLQAASCPASGPQYKLCMAAR